MVDTVCARRYVRAMRRLALIAALVAVAAPAAVSTAGASKSLVVKVPLPGANSGGIREVHLTLTTTKASTGGITVRVLDDKAFGNASAVAVVQSPQKPGKRSTFTIDVLVRTFQASPDRRTATASGPQFQIGIQYDSNDHVVPLAQPTIATCTIAGNLDRAFEAGQTTVVRKDTASGTYYTAKLVSLRPVSEQDSPPEEVLDNVVAAFWPTNGCPGQPEGDDPGPK